MSQIRKTIGQQVRKYRKAKGYTQAQLAEAAQLSQDSIWAIERQKSTPMLETLEQLTQVLNVELVELLVSRRKAASEKDREIEELVELLKVRDVEDVRLVKQLTVQILKRLEART